MPMSFRFRFWKTLFAILLLGGFALPAFAETGAPPAQPQEPRYDFSVTSVTKDQTHPHFGEGSPLGFAVDGEQGRTLVLARGKAYIFNVNTGPMHDFYLSTDSLGWGTAPLTEGVGGNFTHKGAVTFNPSADTPDTVYYACRNHKFMGGEIQVVNPGDEKKIKKPVPRSASRAGQTGLAPLDKNEIRQRLSFVNMFVNNSAASKRIAASENEEAKAKHQSAQDRLAEAMVAFEAENLPETKSKFDEAMALMNEAAKLVPSESALKQAKTKNEDLLRTLADMESSYKQNREAVARETSARNLPKLDDEKLGKMKDEAKTLAEAGKYEEANKILSAVAGEVSGALNKLLANRTVAYEMKFESPAEEYQYELDRFDSLDKSIPEAIDQKQPSASTLSLADGYLEKSKNLRNEAGSAAKRKDYPAALESIRKGTEQLETVLKLLGVH